MSDEVREISVVVRANQAIRELSRIQVGFDNLGSALGKSDADLRKFDRQVDRTQATIVNAAQAIKVLQAANKTLEGDVKRGEAAQAKAEKTLERSRQENLQAAESIKQYRAQIKAQQKDLTALNTENNKLLRRIEQLENANKELTLSFDKLKSKTSGAEAEIGRFGAAAVTTVSRLKQLEVQMDAVTGAQLAQLNLPRALGGGNDPRAVLRNPQTTALSQMTNGQLAQISQAYSLQNQTLEQRALAELQRRFTGIGEEQMQFSNALRYQLYDIVGLFGATGAAAVGLSTAFLGVGIAWEKNFANVERTSQTTGAAVEKLRNDFLRLQTEIPVTSAELAEIGTLGAQMGVAAADLARFTEVVAKFSSTSGLSVDEAATALSRLDELLPDVEGNYNRLGSAILKTGVNAVATEQQIVRGTNQIASIAQVAGLATPEIIGLASALSSLGFSPELQRSIVTSSFSRILRATTEVTAETEKYGAVLGITGAQFQAAWRATPLETYRDLLSAIASRGDAVSVLSDLGLASQRLTPNLLKIGQNTEVLNTALADTNQGWREQTELTRQYDITARTVAARIQVLGQTWEALLVSLGDSDGVLGGIIDGLTQILRVMLNISQSPALSTMVTMVAVLSALAGAALIGAGGLALVTAGTIAMFNATSGLNVALAQNAGVTDLNSISKTRNAAASGAAAAATGAHTAAVGTNTVSVAANSAAMNAAALGFAKTSSRVLTLLPQLLRFTSLVGIGVTAATGLAVVLNDLKDIRIDFTKLFSGAEGMASIDINLDGVEEAEAELAQLARRLRDEENKGAFGNVLAVELDIDDAEATRKANLKDLEDTILALGSTEERIAAIDRVSRRWGVSTDEVLERLPGLASGLGDAGLEAINTAKEVEQLATANEQWSASLGLTMDQLDGYKSSIKSMGSSFMDFGSILTDAYDFETEGLGGGLQAFIDGVGQQIADFEEFSGKITELTQLGGINLAGFFAEQGPDAMQALTDTLQLSPEQLAQLEDQMALAAFYASDAFAEIFTQNNAVLAQVFRDSGGNQEAVAAFNTALNDALRAGVSIDAATLASLNQQFGLEIPFDLVADIDEDQYTAEVQNLQTIASAEAITVTTILKDPVTGMNIYASMDAWRVTENGKTLVLDVDPNTQAGRDKINEWRNNEYQDPVRLTSDVITSEADRQLDIWRRNNKQFSIDLRVNPVNLVTTAGARLGSIRAFKTGGLIIPNTSDMPAFATGGQYGQFRGPGTGTSDSILARVSNGEYINRARAVQYYGTDFFDDINRMRIPRYATGDQIGMGRAAGGGASVNVEVNQYYPTTQDPIQKLKEDAEAVVAGIWN